MIYLDYSAHTPADPWVIETYAQTAAAFIGNPNSTHAAGRSAADKLKEVTASTAAMLGISPGEIIYTSGASEANNLAIKGLSHACRHIGGHIISTALEHSSVGGALTALQERGWEVDLLHIGRNGKIDLDDLRSLLRKDTVLVSICAVDSELGTVQPLDEIANILKDYPNCRLHIDATQAIGKIPLFDFHLADTVSFTPHKFYGLLGTGILYKKQGVILTPQIHGGVSSSMYRSGTPDLAGAAALNRALDLALTNFPDRLQRVETLNKILRARLISMKEVRINSPEGGVPHILNLSVKGIKGGAMQAALDNRGICVSVKSACSVKGTPSKAVYAVSHDRSNALSSFRISLSHLTTEEELETFLEAFEKCKNELTL